MLESGGSRTLGVCGLWGPHCQPWQGSCSGVWVGEAGVEQCKLCTLGVLL